MEIVVDNGKAKLTLDELGLTQPGMARLMAEIGPRMHKAYYAVSADNWPLARYMLAEARKIFEISAIVRPKYGKAMEDFLGDYYAPLQATVTQRDGDAFRAAFEEMVRASHAYHEQFEKGFIRWRLPDQPPADLDLMPR